MYSRATQEQNVLPLSIAVNNQVNSGGSAVVPSRSVQHGFSAEYGRPIRTCVPASCRRHTLHVLRAVVWCRKVPPILTISFTAKGVLEWSHNMSSGFVF